MTNKLRVGGFHLLKVGLFIDSEVVDCAAIKGTDAETGPGSHSSVCPLEQIKDDTKSKIKVASWQPR